LNTLRLRGQRQAIVAHDRPKPNFLLTRYPMSLRTDARNYRLVKLRRPWSVHCFSQTALE
jgi:hypothetical protein